MATQETLNQVQQLYVAYYGRPADAAGLAFWADELEANGGDVSVIINDFGNSAEFEARFGEMSNEELVNNLYQQLFGRDADDEGLAFYTGHLESGDLSLAEIASEIAGGAQDNEDGDNDLTTLNNKVAAANLYTAATEGQHDGTDADNYAADWLATVNADTDVDAIDMDEVVANLPEPTDPTEPEEPSIPGETFTLTTGRDTVTGTAGNDTFNAYIEDNANTLQNGDVINGGAGIDTLYAEIGNSQSFAIQPRLENVENVVISTFTTSTDNSDNNLDSGRGVQIDAGQSRGVTNWESNDSRADLIIEDVRINSNQVTKDVTITFRDSDPGNVDYAVYFDQQSLISEAPETTNSIVVEIANPLEQSLGFNPEAPLDGVPYTHFTFLLNGESQTVAIDLSEAQTYDDLEAALVEALSDYPELTIERLVDGKTIFSRDGQTRDVDLFTVTIDNGTIEPTSPGWNAEGGLPSDNAFSATVTQGTPDETDPLVTSTIVLDNVGRGSTGGDLVVGGLSAGNTSTSQGVQQFDVTVEQTSSLQFLGSTADSLEVVNLVNSGVHHDVVDGKVVERAGNLNLLGDVDVAGFGFDTAVGKANLPSVSRDQNLVGADGQNSGYGLVNVREINAQNFEGDISLTALLDENVTDKYLDLKDQAPDASGVDNVNFGYNLGAGNDKLALAISSSNLADAGTTNREDFNLLIDAGAGDDVIEVAIYDALVGGGEFDAVNNLASGDDAWYTNSQLNANLAIEAGAGNDTVITHGSGDWYIDLGAGNDVLYASVNSSNDNAVWVFNTADQNDADARNIDNLVSGANTDFGGLFKSVLTVEFLGYEAEVTLGAGVNTAREVNQAIKTAIQDDAVLSALLEVSDGPANTLVIESLIDGGMLANNPSVSIEAPTGTAGEIFTAAEVIQYNNLYGTSFTTSTEVETEVGSAVTAFVADTGYVPALATDDTGADITGDVSGHVANNTINAGTGNDVIVLGTGEGSDTIVLEDVFGTNTIVHFEAGADGDVLDFTFYGVNEASLGSSDYNVSNDEVNVVTGGNFDTLNEAYVAGQIGTVGTGVIDSIILVENADNLGEYMAFDVNSENGSTDVTVNLIGVLDFGATQTFADANFA